MTADSTKRNAPHARKQWNSSARKAEAVGPVEAKVGPVDAPAKVGPDAPVKVVLAGGPDVPDRAVAVASGLRTIQS